MITDVAVVIVMHLVALTPLMTKKEAVQIPY